MATSKTRNDMQRLGAGASFEGLDIKERVARNAGGKKQPKATPKRQTDVQRMLRKLCAGAAMTNWDACRMTQSEAGGRRLRQACEQLADMGVRVIKRQLAGEVVAKYIHPLHLAKAKKLLDVEV